MENTDVPNTPASDKVIVTYSLTPNAILVCRK